MQGQSQQAAQRRPLPWLGLTARRTSVSMRKRAHAVMAAFPAGRVRRLEDQPLGPRRIAWLLSAIIANMKSRPFAGAGEGRL